MMKREPKIVHDRDLFCRCESEDFEGNEERWAKFRAAKAKGKQ